MTKDERLKMASVLVTGSLQLMERCKKDDAWNSGVMMATLLAIDVVINYVKIPMPDIKLRSCPFCGYEAEMKYTQTKRHPWSTCGFPYVKCSVCGASSTVKDTEREAASAWNRRADDEHEF